MAKWQRAFLQAEWTAIFLDFLIVGTDGIVWYAANLKGYIGRYDPKTDEVTKITMPDASAKDPHTLVFDQTEEHIWFTVQWGNFIGRLTIADQAN